MTPDAPPHPPVPDVPPASVAIAPEPRLWREWLARRPALSPRSRAFREALRLPLDVPIILSGHQASFWHPGILAKYLAASHAQAAFGAAAAWLWVDQDPEDFTVLRVPARIPGSGEPRFEARRARLISEEIAALLAADHAPCAIGPVPVRDHEEIARDAFAGAAPGTESVAVGLARASQALRDAGSGTVSAAQQVAAALARLIAPLVSPLPSLFASALSRTEFVGRLVGLMRDDPLRCAQAYNHAVARFPRAGILPLAQRLSATGAIEDVELPLWRISPTEPRRQRVWASQLASVSPLSRAELVPRALFLTGILRLGACDLFIHGTGGGGLTGTSGYDAVTDAWFAVWLPEERLAPTATVTATMLLPLAAAPPPSDTDVARARWRAHHARHDGAFLGAEAGQEKARALAHLRGTGSRADRRAAYLRMHAAMSRARTDRASQLAALDAEAIDLQRRHLAGAVAADRTWAFPLHAEAALRGLSEQIRELLQRG